MKRTLAVIFFCLLSVNLFSQVSFFCPDEFILNGDVKVKWLSEWGGEENHNFRTEANLGFDYLKNSSWMCAKVKGATANGKDSIVYLDKVYAGYNGFQNDVVNIDLEIGRNKMDDMFTSKLQFDSYFNGLHCDFTYAMSDNINLQVHGGPFVIDCQSHHYGWIAEAVWKEALQMPLTLSYSLTDWNKPSDQRYDYIISQMSGLYEIGPVQIYGAYLLNHHYVIVDRDPAKYPFTTQKKETAYGYYMGFTVGQIIKAKDCSIDICYQRCKSFAVPLHDFKGLLRGVETKIVCAVTDALTLQAKFALHDADANKRLEMRATYSW